MLRLNGFDVMIFTRDHTPAHVHVFRGDGEIVIEIDTGFVRDVWGLNARESRQARELVQQHKTFLAQEWERIKPIP